MKKRAQTAFLAVFLLVLFTVPLLILSRGLLAQTSFFENRTLADHPALTREGLLSGDYFSQWDTWLTDHVAGRELLLSWNTWLDYTLLDRPVVNDIVTGDGVLLPFQTYGRWDLDYLKDMAAASGDSLKTLDDAVAAYGGRFYYLGLPLQNAYFYDRYPDYLENRKWHIDAMSQAFSDALAQRDIDFLDMDAVYAAQGRPEAYFSASDHHFTYYGAYAAYRTMMEHIRADSGLELPVLAEEELTFTALPNPFLGSRNRKLYGLWEGRDQLVIGTPIQEIPFTRWDNGQEVAARLYDLPQDDQCYVTYDVYMGGDKAETILRTDRPELPNLLIFGDSFTNPLETLFYTGFNETRSLDLRYYTDQGLLDYIAQYQPDVVICVRDDTAYLSLEGNGRIQ